LEIIHNLTREIKIGEVFKGKVVRIMDFGAFVELAGGKDGMCHISELAWHRVGKVEDVVKLGDELEVKVIEIDHMGRINLSHKVLIPRPEGTPDSQPYERPARPSGGRGGDRGGFRPRH
jgi:polyribonucleotide nucleotidyltransferase